MEKNGPQLLNQQREWVRGELQTEFSALAPKDYNAEWKKDKLKSYLADSLKVYQNIPIDEVDTDIEFKFRTVLSHYDISIEDAGKGFGAAKGTSGNLLNDHFILVFEAKPEGKEKFSELKTIKYTIKMTDRGEGKGADSLDVKSIKKIEVMPESLSYGESRGSLLRRRYRKY